MLLSCCIEAWHQGLCGLLIFKQMKAEILIAFERSFVFWFESNSVRRLQWRGKSLVIRVAVSLSAQTFLGSINRKWLALAAFTLKVRKWGVARGAIVQRRQIDRCVVRGTDRISYLSPLFGLHALGVQHNHWGEKRWGWKRREKKREKRITLSLNCLNQASCFLEKCLFCSFFVDIHH